MEAAAHRDVVPHAWKLLVRGIGCVGNMNNPSSVMQFRHN